MGVAVGVELRGATWVEARAAGGVRFSPWMLRGIDLVQPSRPFTISAPRLLAMRRMRRVGCSDRFAGLHEGDPVDWTLRLTDPCPAPAAATSPNLAPPVPTPGERS